MSASSEEAVPPIPIQLRLCIVSHHNMYCILCIVALESQICRQFPPNSLHTYSRTDVEGLSCFKVAVYVNWQRFFTFLLRYTCTKAQNFCCVLRVLLKRSSQLQQKDRAQPQVVMYSILKNFLLFSMLNFMYVHQHRTTPDPTKW